MTHAESQDLIIDLAYGELDADRAAQVQSHVETCAECRREKAALDEARRLAAPLRELEEPSPGFDDRILAAARAQAKLEHDGNVGRVIEVTGSVRPLGMEAARIDAHGPVKARGAERRRPRWLVRAAVGGSIAAAAALALVVNTTLEARRVRERSEAARSDEYQIRVQPAAPQSLDSALRDAKAKRESDRSEAAEQVAPAPPPPAVDASPKDKVAQLRELKPPRRTPSAAGARAAGSGGDVPAFAYGGSPASEAESSRLQKKALESNEIHDINSGGAVAGVPAGGIASAPESGPVAVRAEQRGMKGAAPVQIAASGALSGMQAAAAIEASAQEARHRGDYVQAASLYRQAAALRQRDKDPAAAAWNLAHAVECLSAVGQFAEARGVRDDLVRSYPSEAGALSAARRALRESDSTVPVSH